MAVETPCQTNDAIYSIIIESSNVGIAVSLPFELNLSPEDESILKGNLHNVMELVLSRYFNTIKP